MLFNELDPTAVAVIGIGLVLLVLALVSKTATSWAARLRLVRALESPDAATRSSAIDIATSQSLGRHARVLAKIVERETDEGVLDALAAAVMRDLWEPADSHRMVELRLWAQRRRRQPASSDAIVPVAVATVTHDRPAPVVVVVTGAGGPAGVNVIRALLKAGHEVVGVDVDPLAAGLHLASRAELVVKAADPEFVDQILQVARVHRAHALISTIAEELWVLAERRDDVLERVGAWLPSMTSLANCMDKWRFARLMQHAGIRVPATALGEAADVPGPWVVKPRAARGSRGVLFVDKREDLDAALRSTSDAIVQTRVNGCEFSVDVLVSRDGELVGAVPRWRLETKAGISTRGRTFYDDGVLDGVTSVIAAVGLDGAANVQGFVDGEVITFIEVNPRFSGGLALSLAAGADLVGEYLRGVLGSAVSSDRLAFRPGTTMIRHFEEIYT